MKKNKKALQFQIELLSDGEPGSGQGNETINSYVTRDHTGLPVIRSSHLKGLIRMNIRRLAECRGWSPNLADLCCGSEGAETTDGGGLFKLSDARNTNHANTNNISRTALSALGTAHSGSLRTSESISAGAIFQGTIRFLGLESPVEAHGVLFLALMMIDSIGGGRNRGSGRCRVTLANEDRLPGSILRELDEVLSGGDIPDVKLASDETLSQTTSKGSHEAMVMLHVQFAAEDAVCCPELPVVSNNVISSGLGIPASAVLGAIITCLAQVDSKVADKTLFDPRTRFWPLLPCGTDKPSGEGLGAPVRVSLSHRLSKLPNTDGNHDFKDPALDPFDWRQVAQGSPLKGSDGVLIRSRNGEVTLWKGGDMPRVVTAHAVINNRRNLYTVESQAPMIYAGWVWLPSDAASALSARLHDDSYVCFGKSRSVRGGGHISVSKVEDPNQLFAGWSKNVFVLQSPVAIPDEWRLHDDGTGIQSAERLLAKLLQASGWGTLASPSRQTSQIAVTSQARCGVRFGWNRHGVGSGVASTRRLQARRVFLPGTVFQLESEPKNLSELLQRGLGVERDGDIDGRIQGYGAVLPHPGVAQKLFQHTVKVKNLKSGGTGKLAWFWFEMAKNESPTPSQISNLAARLKEGTTGPAINYLNTQLQRPEKIYQRWKNIAESISTEIQRDPIQAEAALRAYADLVTVNIQSKE